MGNWREQPVIYEINTTVWLNSLSRAYGKTITLSDVPDAELERLAKCHFDALWLMGVWRRSPASAAIARTDARLLEGYRAALPDYQPEDAVGSPFAVHDYSVDPNLGADEQLRELRLRMRGLDLRLILDFVPNHLARDHAWVTEHPEYLVSGAGVELEKEPTSWFAAGQSVFAHGRDPNFPAWTDTVQIDYRRAEARAAVTQQLLTLANRCDGLRCDMAMLPTRGVFCQTWGGQFEGPGDDFWPEAVRAVKSEHPDFVMLAEVYWDLEFDLLQQGFDYAYDKRLYERLTQKDPEELRRHLFADIEYQRRLARFIENHDEPRAIGVFDPEAGKAVATAALTLPGLRLIHEGQMEGFRVRVPVQLRRGPDEPARPELTGFYSRLLNALALPPFHEGQWRLLECKEAWLGNGSYSNFAAHRWASGGEIILVVANLSPERSQCHLPMELPSLNGCSWELEDLLGDARYEREGDDLLYPGLYLDLPGYGCHIFQFHLMERKLPAGISYRSTLHALNRTIQSMAWSPDGRTMAMSGGENFRISLVDVLSGAVVRELEGHTGVVGALAWCPVDSRLASGSDDRTVRVWPLETGTPRVLTGPVDSILTVAWSLDGRAVAAGGKDRRVYIWDFKGARPSHSFGIQSDSVNSLLWFKDGRLAVGSGDCSIHIWDPIRPELLHQMHGSDWVSSIALSPDGKIIAAGTGAGAVDIWSAETWRPISIRQGHTERVLCVAFSRDGNLLASKSADGSVRLWSTDSWEELAVIEERGVFLSGLVFHSRQPLLATRDDRENAIRIWELDQAAMSCVPGGRPTVHYASAKVVVVGESGTGKTCLVNALLGKPFVPQPSTQAMEIELFHSEDVPGPGDAGTTREIMLWDLAGQPEYQLIHQLFLDQTAVALVLFDGTHRERPMTGIRHWENALRRQLAGDRPRILVAGRVDRGHPTVNRPAVEEFRQAHGFCAYVPTSAQTGEGIEELRQTIARHIPWQDLPFVSSPELWKEIRVFLVERRAKQPLLLTSSRLKTLFVDQHRDAAVTNEAFNKVIELAQVQGLVWRLSFGDYVLLKPELLNWYGSAIVLMARKQEDGLGSLVERDVLEGRIDFGGMERLDPELERALLHGVVQLFVEREIALREGDRLVFPSKFSRPRPEVPELPPTEVCYTFAGSVEDVYSTLIVRLFYGRVFQLDQLWKNAAQFRDALDRVCGLRLDEVEEGRGTISVYYDPATPIESKLLFLRFVHEHVLARSLPGSAQRQRNYRCANPECNEAVTDKRAVEARLKRGEMTIPCQFCATAIPLVDVLETKFGDVALLQGVREMETKADQQRVQAVARTISGARDHIREFDVFLAYNNQDRETVRQIAKSLQERGLTPWFDEWHVLPGQSFLDEIGDAFTTTRCAAVFIGPSGLGAWQRRELNIAINQFVKAKRPVIPVFLPGVEREPPLPLFLQEFSTVRFTTRHDDEALERLVSGIAGRR